MTETRQNARLYERAIIRISSTGDGEDTKEDVRNFLQGLVTQDIQAVKPDAPQWSALLSPQGKALFDFFLWEEAGDILLDCEKQVADALVGRLKIYRLRRKIDIEIDQNIASRWALDATDKPTDPRLAALGYRWLTATSDDDEEGADEQYRAHRLSLGVTEGQAELGNDKTLWLECNADELNGVSFTKGCYIGQENTARMNYRKKVNRRLVVVPLDKADEKRQRTVYPILSLSVEHRRIDDLAGLDLPMWLKKTL